MTVWRVLFAVTAGIGLALMIIFIYLYATRSAWRETAAGKTLMASMSVKAVLFAMIFLALLIPGGLGPVAWTCGLATLDTVIARWLWLLHREQRKREET